MADITLEQAPLVIDTAAAQRAGRCGIDLHAISLILIATAAPVVALNVIYPSLLDGINFPAMLLMVAVFVVSAGIYVHSVLSPGKIIAAAFDPAGQTVTLIHDGRFAIFNRDIHFTDIAAITMKFECGADSSPTEYAELRLKNGRSFALPEGTEESHILSIREVVGLA
jgi:hypothetical protein